MDELPADVTVDLRLMRTFRAAARSGSFTRAAEALSHAQSTVTAQIQTLERELQVPLFDRVGRRVVLTTAGHRLLPYADRLLALAEEARGAINDDGNPAGTITIGAPETLCTYRLPPLLGRFRAQYPQVRLIFQPTSHSDVQRSLRDGSLDVAFILGPPMTAPGLEVEPLLIEPVHLLVAPEHRLAHEASVRPVDLIDESVLLTEAGCAYRQLFLRSLEVAGSEADAALEFSSVEAIKQCAIAGMGIAVLPAVAVGAEVTGGRLSALRWAGADLTVTTQMVWHRERWVSPALKAFLDAARAVLCSTQG